jgi:hypothetical protein
MAVMTTQDEAAQELRPHDGPRGGGRATALLGLALLSAAAGAIHVAFAPAHMEESWTHGAFFAAVGLFQIGWALAVLTRRSPAVVRSAVLNIGVIATWLVSRTIGVPFSDVEGTEAIGFADVTATAFEAVLVAGALALSVRWRPVAAPRLTVLGGAVALIAAGMTVAAVSPATGGTEHLHAGDDAALGLAGDTPCEQSGAPASPAQVTDTGGHFHRGPSPQQPINETTRQLLAEQQAQARTVVDRFPTVGAALAGGYHQSTPYVPCIGAHYTNTSLIGRFDPAAPSELLFDGTELHSRIVGLSYLVWNPDVAPEGFAGPNDVWHQHNDNGGLCFNGDGLVIGGEEVSAAECQTAGGEKRLLPDLWMVHDWIVPGWECTWGVFAPECPELGGQVGGSAWDPPAPDREGTWIFKEPGT